MESAKDVPFYVKNGHPTPTSPRILNILHWKSSFSLTTRIKLLVSTTKIRSLIGNSPWGFKFWVKNLTGSEILAVSAHSQQKIG